MTQDSYQSFINILNECKNTSNHCFDACLKERDLNKKMAECIRLDRECADICSYLEQAIGRGSRYVKEIANLCATICQECADECKQHQHDHCQKCAEVCLKCAEECRKLGAYES